MGVFGIGLGVFVGEVVGDVVFVFIFFFIVFKLLIYISYGSYIGLLVCLNIFFLWYLLYV